jgi:excinuclease ABC subunit C
METPQETIKNLPHLPGVYIYRDRTDTIIYIGKAKDLKRRVSQYFQRDDAVGPKTQILVSQIASIRTIQTASEFDALILEAKLIHDNSPKYNVVLKDDKSPLYILLTLSEPLPHVITMRRSDLPKKMQRVDALFGPFQSAGVVRSLLRHIRHIVPYCTQKRRNGRQCFYAHIGLCDPCPSDKHTDPAAYRKNIFRLKNILSGKSNMVMKELEKDMKQAASENRFEDAAKLRSHIQNLYGILSKKYDPLLYMSSDAAAEDIYAAELSALGGVLHINKLDRIECFDISNTGGKNATGSMVVLLNGRKDTGQYKRFRIRMQNTPNDFAMMAEVIKRRFTHPEWGKPDLIVIDGGKGQLHSVKDLVPDIPVIGLAKRFEEIIIPMPHNAWKTVRLDLTSPAIHVLQRIRDEAHRFAITYHRLLRKNKFI